MAYAQFTAFWRATDLLELKADYASGLSLVECARRQGPEIHAQDCDVALWTLVGRTAQDAAVILNNRRAA